jgi:LacI family transcriptional regulator
MAATLKQVAEHTQLSIPTVSEILNNKSNRLYRSETRTRVFAMARQLGYRPNGYARSMRSGRFGAIALLQSSLERRSFLPNSLLDSIGRELDEKDLRLTLASVSDEQLADQTFIPHILRTLSVDGLLINYNTGFPERLIDLVRRYRVPSIWINAKPGADCIYPDDVNAARQATQYLLELGHRDIAFVNYNYGHHNDIPVHYSDYDRVFGYAQAIQGAGLAPWEIRGENFLEPHERFAFSLQWLTLPKRPSAVITYTWENALPVVLAARSIGLRVPEDLSVVTFNDHITDELGMRIDTMVLPEAQMGRRAVDWLLEKIEDPSRIFPAEAIGLNFEKGWTTAPPAPVTASAHIGPTKSNGSPRRGKQKSPEAMA